jgi:TATA-binding protein-associated factor
MFISSSHVLCSWFFAHHRPGLSLDRLLVLLDTGSSTNVRHTAAKQLAELAAKSVTGDVKIEEDVKNVRSDVPRADVAAWAELMSVVGRVSC